MIRIIRLDGPAGGPAVISICLVTPGGPRRTPVRLSAVERALRNQRSTRQARADFTAGRTAAHALLGNGVEVDRAADGRPVPSRNGRAMAAISLSIGHSRGCGMAAVVNDAGWLVGVDIETRSRLSRQLARRVLTPREKRRVGRRPPGLRGRATIEHWVLKEAALKTMGGGVAKLISAPEAAEVIRLSRRAWSSINLAGAHQARARLIQARSMTMAVALLRR